MKIVFLLLAVLLSSSVAQADNIDIQHPQPAIEEVAYKLQDALRKNDRAYVAKLIYYPIDIEKPLPNIKSEDEFLKNWGDFFDALTISTIISTKPEAVGWQGTMLDNGKIWFSNGKIIAINMRTEDFKNKLAEAIRQDSLKLYPTAQNYKSIKLECTTSDKHIRVQQHEDGLYYFSWHKDSNLAEKPSIELKGDVENQDSGGGLLYQFKNNNLSYEIFEPHICGEDCNTHISFFDNGKQMSDEICK
jgi:hypothetical protein